MSNSHYSERERSVTLCRVSVGIKSLMSDTNWMLFHSVREGGGNWGKPNEQSDPCSDTWHQWLVTGLAASGEKRGGDDLPLFRPAPMWHDPSCHGPSVPSEGLNDASPFSFPHLPKDTDAFNHLYQQLARSQALSAPRGQRLWIILKRWVTAHSHRLCAMWKGSSTCSLSECMFTSLRTIKWTSIKLLGQMCKQTYATMFAHDWTNADMCFTRQTSASHLLSNI